MLTPAEQLGLAGAALDARVRQAVNFIPDSTLVHVARRLAEDARASDVVYVHDGNGRDGARHVAAAARDARAARLPASRLHAHHERARALPRALCARRRRAPRRAAGRRRARVVRRGLAAPSRTRRRRSTAGSTPSATSRARAGRTRCKFMEPNLSGVGGIHLRAARGDARDARRRADAVRATIRCSRSTRRAISATCSCRCCSIMRARSAATAGTSRSSSRSTSPKAPTSNRTSSSTTARGAASSSCMPIRASCGSSAATSTYEDVRIDVAYRDYEIRDLLALEQEDGQRLDAHSRAVLAEPHGLRDRRRPRSQELLGGADERRARVALLQHRGAAAVPPPRALDAHRQRAAHRYAGRADGSARIRRATTARSSC